MSSAALRLGGGRQYTPLEGRSFVRQQVRRCARCGGWIWVSETTRSTLCPACGGRPTQDRYDVDEEVLGEAGRFVVIRHEEKTKDRHIERQRQLDL